MSQETEMAEQVAAKIAEKATEAPAEQPDPKPKAKKAEPKPEPKAAPKVNPDAPVKVRVLKNFFYDGRRFRAKGEIIALTARQVFNAGDAVERV